MARVVAFPRSVVAVIALASACFACGSAPGSPSTPSVASSARVAGALAGFQDLSRAVLAHHANGPRTIDSLSHLPTAPNFNDAQFRPLRQAYADEAIAYREGSSGLGAIVFPAAMEHDVSQLAAELNALADQLDSVGSSSTLADLLSRTGAELTRHTSATYAADTQLRSDLGLPAMTLGQFL